MSRMNPWIKVVLVIGGYVLACLVASAVVYVNGLLTPADVKLNSSGMTAFGDLILFIGSFGLCALVPTVLGIYFFVRGFILRKQNNTI